MTIEIICDYPVTSDKNEEHLETEEVSNEDEARDMSPSPDHLTVSRRVKIFPLHNHCVHSWFNNIKFWFLILEIREL